MAKRAMNILFFILWFIDSFLDTLCVIARRNDEAIQRLSFLSGLLRTSQWREATHSFCKNRKNPRNKNLPLFKISPKQNEKYLKHRFISYTISGFCCTFACSKKLSLWKQPFWMTRNWNCWKWCRFSAPLKRWGIWSRLFQTISQKPSHSHN